MKIILLSIFILFSFTSAATDPNLILNSPFGENTDDSLTTNPCLVTCKLLETTLNETTQRYVETVLETKGNLAVGDDEDIYFEPVLIDGSEYQFQMWTDDEVGGFRIRKKVDNKYKNFTITRLNQRPLLNLDFLDTSKCERNENTIFMDQSITFYPTSDTYREVKLTCEASK